jgi:hypothetical protein
MEKKGVHLHSEAHELIHDIQAYFKRKAGKKGPCIQTYIYKFPKFHDPAAAACGIGKRIAERILHESLHGVKKCGSAYFMSPKESITRSKKETGLDFLDGDFVRWCLIRVQRKECPTLKNLR